MEHHLQGIRAAPLLEADVHHGILRCDRGGQPSAKHSKKNWTCVPDAHGTLKVCG
jgi:hypothetical protein